MPRESHPLGQTSHVRIDDHTLLHAERVSQDDIGRLARHAAERQERVHAARYFTAKVALKCPSGLHNGTRLVTPEVDGPNEGLDICRRRSCKRRDRRECAEQRRSCPVDGCVGGLC